MTCSMCGKDGHGREFHVPASAGTPIRKMQAGAKVRPLGLVIIAVVALIAVVIVALGASGGSGGAAASFPNTPLGHMQQALSGTADGVVVSKDQPGSYTVAFKIKDNFSSGMIRDGIALDVFKMLQAIAKGGPGGDYVLSFQGTFPMQDKYGKAISPDPVVFRTVFRSSTARRISYDNIDTASYGTISQLADGPTFLHPAMQ